MVNEAKKQQSWVNLDIWQVQPLEKNGILVEHHYLETRVNQNKSREGMEIILCYRWP